MQIPTFLRRLVRQVTQADKFEALTQEIAQLRGRVARRSSRLPRR